MTSTALSPTNEALTLEKNKSTHGLNRFVTNRNVAWRSDSQKPGLQQEISKPCWKIMKDLP